jgi:hypothetical protein
MAHKELKDFTLNELYFFATGDKCTNIESFIASAKDGMDAAEVEATIGRIMWAVGNTVYTEMFKTKFNEAIAAESIDITGDGEFNEEDEAVLKELSSTAEVVTDGEDDGEGEDNADEGAEPSDEE